MNAELYRGDTCLQVPLFLHVAGINYYVATSSVLLFDPMESIITLTAEQG
jgi:hypothetical protein